MLTWLCWHDRARLRRCRWARTLRSLTAQMRDPWTLIFESVALLWSRSGDPKQTSSVFEGLRQSRFEDIQLDTSSKQAAIALSHASHDRRNNNHHHHHLFLKRPLQSSTRVRRFIRYEATAISFNLTHSGSKPSSSISSFTHSHQVFLPLPAPLTPTTTTFLQVDTQSS
jgi:hypothetical protein